MGACVPVVYVRELALRSYWATSEQLGPEGGQVDVRGWRFNGRHTWSSWSWQELRLKKARGLADSMEATRDSAGCGAQISGCSVLI